MPGSTGTVSWMMVDWFNAEWFSRKRQAPSDVAVQYKTIPHDTMLTMQLTWHRDLSDRPRLANQREQTRHSTLSPTASFSRQFRSFSFKEVPLAKGASLYHTRVREKDVNVSLSLSITWAPPHVCRTLQVKVKSRGIYLKKHNGAVVEQHSPSWRHADTVLY